jgi:hypothetical protein
LIAAKGFTLKWEQSQVLAKSDIGHARQAVLSAGIPMIYGKRKFILSI